LLTYLLILATRPLGQHVEKLPCPALALAPSGNLLERAFLQAIHQL
jgi:hypothetical protein